MRLKFSLKTLKKWSNWMPQKENSRNIGRGWLIINTKIFKQSEYIYEYIYSTLAQTELTKRKIVIAVFPETPSKSTVKIFLGWRNPTCIARYPTPVAAVYMDPILFTNNCSNSPNQSSEFSKFLLSPSLRIEFITAVFHSDGASKAFNIIGDEFFISSTVKPLGHGALLFIFHKVNFKPF